MGGELPGDHRPTDMTAAAWPVDLAFVDDVCGGGWRVGCGLRRRVEAAGVRVDGRQRKRRAGGRRRRQRNQRTWLLGWRAPLGLGAWLFVSLVVGFRFHAD